MKSRRLTYAACMLGVWLCFDMVIGQNENSVPLGSLVPRIEQLNQKLYPMGQRYTLVIELPDGSNRVDNVELRAPNTPEQELFVMGTITNYYPVGTSITVYEAGKNGYTVKYTYIRLDETAQKPLHLSPNALKSAAG